MIYGAERVEYTPAANKQLKNYEDNGFGKLPVCIAKTHLSISGDASLKGAPTGHTLTVREARASVGAGFVYPIAGEMRTMPGLGRPRRRRRSSTSTRTARSSACHERGLRPHARRCDPDGRQSSAGRDRRAARAAEIEALGSPAVCLATVLVGDDEPAQIYVRMKQKKAAEAGMLSKGVELPGPRRRPRSRRWSRARRRPVRARHPRAAAVARPPRP